MSSILKESDVLWQNGSSQSWDVPREDSTCSDRSDWQLSQWNGMTETRDSPPAVLTGSVVVWYNTTRQCRTLRDQRRGQLYPHHPELQDADSLVLGSALWEMCQQRWRGKCSEGSRAKATTPVTGCLLPVTALLESISYTQHLSVGRISAGLPGAQGSGQTA